MSSKRNSLRLICAAAICAASNLTFAQTFLNKPLHIVVPFGVGGVADLTARAIGQKLSEHLGQPVVVDNRPGAGGLIGGNMVAKSDPDGETLLLMSNATAVSAGLFASLPYDTKRDFAPVSLLGTFDLAVVVPENSRFKSLKELIEFGRSHPGELNIGTINIGSTQHLAAELMRTQANFNAQIIPYKGTPAVISALRGGQIDLAVELVGPLKPQVSAKTLRLLGVMGAQRAKDLPDVPTLSELPGLSNFNVSSWNALAAQGKTPKAVIEKLNVEVKKILDDPAVVKQLASFNVHAQSSTPQQLGSLLDSEITRWSGVIKSAGIEKK